jgi:cell division protein FtsI/penicillin-binding protein 2
MAAALRQAFRDRRGAAVLLALESGRTLAAWRPDVAKTLETPPGSAVKPFTLRALLPHGTEALACKRHLTIAGQTLDCTHPVFAELLDAEMALAWSCNCWFAAMAPRLRPDELVRELNRAGFRAGLARDADALALQAIGMAGVRITPLAMARAYRRLAVDLRRNTPALAPIRRGLARAVEEGTAQSARPAVSGKTGTTREGCWFAGFDETAALTVFLESGQGASDAAPVAGEVFRAWRAAHSH